MKIHLSENTFTISFRWVPEGLSCTLKTLTLLGQSPRCGKNVPKEHAR